MVKATLQLAKEGETGICYHLSTEESISIRDLVGKICERAGVAFDSVVEEGEERLGKDQSYLLDSSRMRERFGWHDGIGLDEGLTQTLGWVDANYERLSQLPWHYIHKT